MPISNDDLMRKLEHLDEKMDKLPCSKHGERIRANEVKVKNLNDIRKMVMGTLLRWAVPILIAGLGTGAWLKS